MIYTHDSKDFNKAVALFKDDQYASAQIIFNKVKETATTEELKSDCAYYAANCAIRTNQSNADDELFGAMCQTNQVRIFILARIIRKHYNGLIK
jgi:hypothetical protein